MTEEKARTKWCPMIRHMVYPTEPSGGNLPIEISTCIASDCAVWNWIDDFDDNIIEGHCGLIKA